MPARHPYPIQQLLGGLSVGRFLSEYWQKKPLLVRQAIPGFQGLLTPEGLKKLAEQEDAESRLVSHRRGQWNLDHGPFDAEQLGTLPTRGWSLLVSGVNHFLAEADALLHAFNFIPYSRLDDLMVSLAPTGGGVGPHFDSYDVFLIQGFGRRRWEISAQEDLELVAGAPLRILKHFEPEQSWELEPGDMLYLPPKYAHNGVALGECMTYSVGFRAPSTQEIATQFLVHLQDTIALEGRYADPDLKRQRHPAEISAAMLEQITGMIKQIQWGRADILEFVGRYISEPKAHVFFEPPRPALGPAAFLKQACRRGVTLDRRSQLLFRGCQFFCNGERFDAPRHLVPELQRLADTRNLPAQDLSDELSELLHAWYLAGYVHLGHTPKGSPKR